jgi:hypothetical protein
MNCCCCDSIGWIQAIRGTADWTGLIGVVPEFADNFDWRIDRKLFGSPIYPGGSGFDGIPSSGDPCTMKMPVGIADEPQNPTSHWRNSTTLVRMTKEFETCVCISGQEGIWAKPPVGCVDASHFFLGGMAVYGCVRWGYTVSIDRSGKYRTAFSLYKTDAAPSQNFEKAVRREYDRTLPAPPTC